MIGRIDGADSGECECVVRLGADVTVELGINGTLGGAVSVRVSGPTPGSKEADVSVK